jgi:hypothetical protein
MSGWTVYFRGLTVKGFAEALSAACSGFQDFEELSARFRWGHGKVLALEGTLLSYHLSSGRMHFGRPTTT